MDNVRVWHRTLSPNTTLQEALKSSPSRFPHAGPPDVSIEALRDAWGRMGWAGGPGEPRELCLRDCRNFPDGEALCQVDDCLNAFPH